MLQLCLNNFLFAQTDVQKNIVLENRVYTISKDSSGNWVIPEWLKKNILTGEKAMQPCDSIFIGRLLQSYFKKED